MGNIAKLTPAPSFKIWGGQKLSKIKNLNSATALGESWEISTHFSAPSFLEDKKLSELCDLSYLFKYIDTGDNLSVQVHPPDEYAKENENDSGKAECWIILEAEDGAGVYLGLKPGITKKEFKTAIENGLALDKYLNFFPAKPGDFFYVEEGTVHAIGEGVLLAEAQQSSGVTYRVWDWNRVGVDGKPRELHIDKAMDVINFSDEFNCQFTQKKVNVFKYNGIKKIIDHKDFKVHLLDIKKDDQVEIRLKDKEGISVLQGEVCIDELNLSLYESALCLQEGMMNIKAHSNSKVLLISE